MKCILHIGTEKTGSTSIQDFLHSNKNILRKLGFSQSEKLGKTSRLLVAAFEEENEYFCKPRNILNKEIFFNEIKENLKKEILKKSKNSHTFILTSEHFHSRLKSPDEINELYKFLNSLFSEIKVVCYFREQSQVHLSLYSTSLRVGHNFNLANYFQSFAKNSHYYNYNVMFTKWAKVFGKNNLLPVLFSKNNFFGGSLISDFLHRCCVKTNFENFKMSPRRSNTKFNLKQIILLRAINLLSVKRNIEAKKKRAFYESVINSQKILHSNYIYHPHAEFIYQECNKSNINFFHKFFFVRENLFEKPVSADNKQKKDIDFIEESIPLCFDVISTYHSKKIKDNDKLISFQGIIGNEKFSRKLLKSL